MPCRRPPYENTISSLVEKRQALLLVCVTCDTQRHLSPLEAIATYGGGIGFQELTTLLRARCGDHCQTRAEPSIRKPDELVVRRIAQP
jgi:hypothetical protein